MQPGAFIQVAAGFQPAARGWAGELTLAGAQERYVAPICPRNSNSRSGRDLAGAGLEVTGPECSVLIGCEYSATERDAFRAAGADAWSCDLKPTEGDPRWHIQGDVREAIKSRNWDTIILHVDCTAMAVCGNRTYGRGKPKHHLRQEAISWTVETARMALEQSPYVALENPASVIFPVLRDQLGADVQYIQPWQFGHLEQKKTGLALWGLPRLAETSNVYAEMMKLPRNVRERIHYMAPSPDRAHERARAFPGIAEAMVAQWLGALGHTAAHYSTDIIGSTALTTFHCTAPF